MKVTLDLINSIRQLFYDHNYQCCPDDKIRLELIVEKHFVERLFQRFSNQEAASLIKEAFEWIDQQYCILLFETHMGSMKRYRIQFDTGTVVFGLYDNKLRVRTCFKGGEEYELL